MKLPLLLLFVLAIPLASAIGLQDDENYSVAFIIGSGVTTSYDGIQVSSVTGEPGIGNRTGGIFLAEFGILYLVNVTNITQEEAVVEEEELPAPGTGGGSVSGSAGKSTSVGGEEIKKEAGCNITQPLFRRIFSTCKIEGNGICDDGENLFLHKDCTLPTETLGGTESFEKVFYMMWLLRVVLIVAAILLVKKSRYFPILATILLYLMLINGVHRFVFQEELDALGDTCYGMNFFSNLAICTFPLNNLLGWIINISIAILLWSYYNPKKKKKPIKKPKPKKKEKEKSLVPALAVFIFYTLLMSGGHSYLFQEELDALGTTCQGLNFLKNVGICTVPVSSLVGWAVNLTIIYFLARYYLIRKKKTKNYLKVK